MVEIEEQRACQGPMTNEQLRVIGVFCLTVLLWFFGSSDETWLGLPESVSSAAMVSILAVCTMFGLGLLDMKDVHATQWDIIILLGNSLLLGDVIIGSGTAELIGSSIADNTSVLPWVLVVLILICVTMAFTNFISNTATAAILVPITIQTSIGLDMGPTILVMAIGLSSSVAFITPVGTPTTAMIYGTGHIPKEQLVKNGLLAASIVAVATLVFLLLLPVP